MSVQECALYGDLVLYLRDRAAELLTGGDDVEAERTRLDAIIHDWFFTPQDELHGCAPRELIWAEQKGEPNPIHADRLAEFFDDDCPICQAMHQEVKAAIEAGEEHGWHWHHDDGGCPLISIYDPEGWDERWAEGDAAGPNRSLPLPERGPGLAEPAGAERRDDYPGYGAGDSGRRRG